MIEKNTRAYRRITLSLALGSFIVFCNLYLFQPMLPFMATHFSVSETTVNWVFAATTMALSISLVPWAVASESIGRRCTMFLGLLSIPIIGLAMAFTTSLVGLIILRAFMGFALAAFASVAVAYMVEELSSKAFNYAIGGYIAANSLGGIAGRIVGGTLTDAFGWQNAVLVMTLFSLCGALAVFFSLPSQQNFTPQKGLLRYHNRALIKHIRNRKIWLAMLIGGINFALFVNLYSVMGFRLVSAPHNMPMALASLIFLCYLAGTLSSKLTANWLRRFHSISGMIFGSLLSLMGMLIANIETISFMIAGLLLISFGAFFTHTLAYSWVSKNATHAKATATALYLVHYYIGGSLGGFFLIFCWQHGGWGKVTAGGSLLFALIFLLCFWLNQFDSKNTRQNKKSSDMLAPNSNLEPK